ncbi:hypothetical protein [Devosia sp. MC521]|uniref:hypothetical protein n=1 Tax=Devosia sp. MC521 TaxID=2759954 RepID=UPI0015F8CFEB|nr:hypothetical protein [Devosia sp. MC521]MBJ6986067.1 hypothetical protein [Devosia sp. MC521]QMW61437.1 hypothetical protein H4N61_10625 [Devosia sp. MC521]
MTDFRDIERLVNSADQYEPPTPEELAEAPLLEGWALLKDEDDEDDLPVVFGIISGHPAVPDGGLHFGAECFAMDENWAWIMTMARLYRLGTPAFGTTQQEDGNVY